MCIQLLLFCTCCRFSRDIEFIDIEIPYTLFDVLETGIVFLMTILLIVVINPWLIISSIFMVFIIYLLRTVYINTSRSMKRLEAISE